MWPASSSPRCCFSGGSAGVPPTSPSPSRRQGPRWRPWRRPARRQRRQPQRPCRLRHRRLRARPQVRPRQPLPRLRPPLPPPPHRRAPRRRLVRAPRLARQPLLVRARHLERPPPPRSPPRPAAATSRGTSAIRAKRSITFRGSAITRQPRSTSRRANGGSAPSLRPVPLVGARRRCKRGTRSRPGGSLPSRPGGRWLGTADDQTAVGRARESRFSARVVICHIRSDDHRGRESCTGVVVRPHHAHFASDRPTPLLIFQ